MHLYSMTHVHLARISFWGGPHTLNCSCSICIVVTMTGVQGSMMLLLVLTIFMISKTNAVPDPDCMYVCPEDVSPVCGSDGYTYNNTCVLNCMGYTMEYDNPCPCDIEYCLEIYKPVCGSDGHTYENHCELNRTKCGNPHLYKVYDGACLQLTTAPCWRGCTDDNNPVCGSDGKTYSNECQLENAIRCSNTYLYKRYDGECFKTTTTCRIACYDDRRLVCGTNGQTYINECHLENDIRCRDPYLSKRHDGPCPSTPTSCATPCYFLDAPVCGSDGKTYPNQCEFENAKRCRKPYLYKRHDGQCGTGGSNCDWPCPKHHQPVCGTNQVTYDNFCLFERAKCRWNIGLKKSNAPCNPDMNSAASTLQTMTALLVFILIILF